MIDVFGPFLLVLMFRDGSAGKGISTQEMVSQQACRAAVVQLEPIRAIEALCIAATVLPEEAADTTEQEGR